MSRILVITHPGGGTSGVFAESAKENGHVLEEWSPAGGGDPARPLSGYDALVVLGGDQNVCELGRFPYLESEIDLIAGWLDSGRPLLGVCLGAQLLAQAAGGEVVRGPQPELGWHDVTLTEDGLADPLLGFGMQPLSTFQWHDYVALPPADAVLLAHSAICLQAFRVGSAWGVQYHPEVTRAIVDGWIDDTHEAAGRDGRSSGRPGAPAAHNRPLAPERDPALAFGDLSVRLAPWMAYGRELFARFAAQA